MLTMEPPPLSRIAGAQCFMPSIGPVRLTASVRFHASTVVSAIPWRAIVPALLTRTWSLPKRPNAAATTSFQEPSSATSWRRNRTLPPSPARRWARLSPAAASMSVKTTAASSRTKSSASAVPWPPAAPVISATLPVNRPISSPPLRRDDGGCHCERGEAISQRRHLRLHSGDHKHGHAAALHRQRGSRQPRRRQRSVDLRRAGQKHGRASRFPQYRADDRSTLRRAAPRSYGSKESSDLSDGVGRVHAQIFRGVAIGRRVGRRARRDRRMVAADLRLARSLAGL